MKLSLSLHRLTSHEGQGVGIAPITLQWMDEGIIFRLVSLYDHGTFEPMLGNAKYHPQAFFQLQCTCCPELLERMRRLGSFTV